MKRIFLMLAMVIFLMVGVNIVEAKMYMAVGGRGESKSDASNLTFELGGVSSNRDFNHFGGIGLSFILNADDYPFGVYNIAEYPCPHSHHTFGMKQKGSEYALFGKYGLEIIKNNGLFIFVLGGFSFAEEIELTRSRITDWYYEQSSDINYYEIFGGGLAYFPVDQKISIQIEYDNRRGVTVGIGFRW